MSRAVSVIVVSPDAERANRWSTWLGAAGYESMVCPGPREVAHCPLVEGTRCSRRELFDIAVLDIRAPQDAAEAVSGGLCLKDPDDGRTVVVSSASVPASFGDPDLWIRELPTRESILSKVRRASRPGPGKPSI